MSSKDYFYPESRFGGFTDIDGTIAFYTRINALLDPSMTVLDIGCGRGGYADDAVAYRRNLRILRGKVAWCLGIDVEPVGHTNPNMDQFRQITSKLWPVESDLIDLYCISYEIVISL